MPRISEFPYKYAPSPSAFVAGVDVNEIGEKINVQIPFSAFGKYKSYHYNAEYVGVTMYMLIKDLEAQGYNCDGIKQPMILTLSGAFGSRIFTGYITSVAGGTACQFELFDLANHIMYSQLGTTASTVPISTILNNARPVKYGSGGIKYVTVDTDKTTTFADIATAIEDEAGSVLGVNFVKLEGGLDGNYLMDCYMYKDGAIGANLLNLNNLTQYYTSITLLTSTLFGLMLDHTYGSVTEVGGGLPYEEVYWGNPDADMLDIITAHVTANSAKKNIIQVVGYNSALLLANGYCHTSEGKMIWTLNVTNLYNGKMLRAEDVDPTTITIYDFLNSGKYEVKQESSGGSPMTSITYAELKALRDSGSLVAGMFYRITDYQCATVQDSTKATDHRFDIIVQALSNSELSEAAKADYNSEDSYFSDNNANLSAWELKYCLDNDTTRFAWAFGGEGQAITNMYSGYSDGRPLTRQPSCDGTGSGEYQYAWGTKEDVDDGDSSNFIYSKNETITNGEIVYHAGDGEEQTAEVIEGKGVIYYMKDEHGNECPYDFKNIQFKRSAEWQEEHSSFIEDSLYLNVGEVEWFYTFSWVNENLGVEDLTMRQDLATDEGTIAGTHHNVIGIKTSNADSELGGIKLSNIVFINTYQLDGGLYCGCCNNTFGTDCGNNTFGNACDANTFGSNCYNNTFGNDCGNNTFGSNCYNNTFGSNCHSNTFGTDCGNNTFGNDCGNNTFGSNCYNNTFGNDCDNNTFGNNCYDNTFDSNANRNYFALPCIDSEINGSGNFVACSLDGANLTKSNSFITTV